MYLPVMVVSESTESTLVVVVWQVVSTITGKYAQCAVYEFN